MKIRKKLQLVYWLVFQDGIEELQNRMKKIEDVQLAPNINIIDLQTRVTILEKQVQILMDREGRPLLSLPNSTEFS